MSKPDLEEALSYFYSKFTRLIKGGATLQAIMDEQSMMPEVVQGQARLRKSFLVGVAVVNSTLATTVCERP